MTRPAAFLSYTRIDDQHHGGLISELRKRLSDEVRIQTGTDFPIFQDREDIAWGQNWQARIDDALDAVTLLLPGPTAAGRRDGGTAGGPTRVRVRSLRRTWWTPTGGVTSLASVPRSPPPAPATASSCGPRSTRSAW
jgi:hypothetical protein